jgi:hypothetical protein
VFAGWYGGLIALYAQSELLSPSLSAIAVALAATVAGVPRSALRMHLWFLGQSEQVLR